MVECIITETFICPNDYISGKICSACKIPDMKREGIIEEDGWTFKFYTDKEK